MDKSYLSPSGASDTLTIAATTVANTGVLDTDMSGVYRIATDAACHVRVSDNNGADATANDMPMFANTSEYIFVPRGHRISIFGASGASGTFWYSRMTQKV